MVNLLYDVCEMFDQPLAYEMLLKRRSVLFNEKSSYRLCTERWNFKLKKTDLFKSHNIDFFNCI
jgi:hypothetical protein